MAGRLGSAVRLQGLARVRRAMACPGGRTSVWALGAAIGSLLGTVAALDFVAVPANAAFPGTNGPIAFQSNRDGPQEIYTIVPGGTANRITTSLNSADPVISPNGDRIAFVNSNNQIAVMSAAGGAATPITSGSAAKQDPTWSPDGSKIAFAANSFPQDAQTDLEIWVVGATGGVATPLTSNTFPDTYPAWSPLGDQIAFVSTRPGDTDRNIYVMNADGNAQTSITPNVTTDCGDPTPETCYQDHDDDPAWSPDGSQIAYVHEREPQGGGSPNIWTMSPAGTGKTNITESTTAFTNPAWSPQGDMLAAVGAVTTNRDIWTMTSSGGSPSPTDTSAANDVNPDWGAPVPASASPPPGEQAEGDGVPPTATITKGPKDKTKKKQATFEFTGTDARVVASFECSLDDGPFTACTSPRTVKVKKGKHTFRVRAIDQAGNIGAAAADNWKVKRKKK